MRDEILALLEEICEDEIVRQDMDCDLFESDLLDSLGFAEFLAELEERFSIVIAPSEVSRETINTPGKILDFIQARS